MTSTDNERMTEDNENKGPHFLNILGKARNKINQKRIDAEFVKEENIFRQFTV